VLICSSGKTKLTVVLLFSNWRLHSDFELQTSAGLLGHVNDNNTMLFELQTSAGLLGHVNDNNTMLFELRTSAGLLGHVNDNNTMLFELQTSAGLLGHLNDNNTVLHFSLQVSCSLQTVTN